VTVATGARVKREGLAPALDAVALGDLEQLVFYNPSPDRDSLLELIPELILPAERRSAEGREFASLLREGVSLNTTQTDRCRSVTGFLDGLVIDLHDRQLNGGGAGALAAKAVAGAVRQPLRAIADLDPEDLAAVVEAVRTIDAVLDRAGRTQALGATVEHELGRRAYELLRDLADSRGREVPPAERPRLTSEEGE
jgi:hypothetical protein